MKRRHNPQVDHLFERKVPIGLDYSWCSFLSNDTTGEAQKALQMGDEELNADFTTVIWTDETTIILQTHRCFCCHKCGQKPCYKSHPKYPVKVHVWAGFISRGATRVCIFEGVMDANLYVKFLMGIWFHLCERCMQLAIGLCRIMILNTPPT